MCAGKLLAHIQTNRYRMGIATREPEISKMAHESDGQRFLCVEHSTDNFDNEIEMSHCKHCGSMFMEDQ